MVNYLKVGHHLFTDNWYTGIELANFLFENKTYLTGTVRKNLKFLPKKLFQIILKKGESVCLQNFNGVSLLRFKDKRDVLMLTTFSDNSMMDKINDFKPRLISAYNNGKSRS